MADNALHDLIITLHEDVTSLKADLMKAFDRISSLEMRFGNREASTWVCKRCGHVWKSWNYPRGCAACRSSYWDREPRHANARTPSDRMPVRKPKRSAVLGSTTNEVVKTIIPDMADAVLPPPPKPPSLSEQLSNRIVVPLSTDLSSEPYAPPVRPEHIAPMPDSVVEQIVTTGQRATYEDIAAAREAHDAMDASQPVEASAPSHAADPPGRDDRTRREKIDAFFASAREAGLAQPESAAPVDTPEDKQPFIEKSFGETIAEVKKDDPFWK